MKKTEGSETPESTREPPSPLLLLLLVARRKPPPRRERRLARVREQPET